MKQRGRKSAAEASVTQLGERRPAPPEDLNDFQKQLWRDVVDTRPADWFRKDTYPLLRGYTKHAWQADEIDKLLSERFDSEDPEERAEIEDLLKARERESRAMMALARSMRITQQSNYDPKTAARAKEAPSKRPWEKRA